MIWNPLPQVCATQRPLYYARYHQVRRRSSSHELSRADYCEASFYQLDATALTRIQAVFSRCAIALSLAISRASTVQQVGTALSLQIFTGSHIH